MKEEEIREIRTRLRSSLIKDKAKAIFVIRKLTKDVDYIDEKLKELDELDREDIKEVKSVEVKKRGFLGIWK